MRREPEAHAPGRSRMEWSGAGRRPRCQRRARCTRGAASATRSACPAGEPRVHVSHKGGLSACGGAPSRAGGHARRVAHRVVGRGTGCERRALEGDGGERGRLQMRTQCTTISSSCVPTKKSASARSAGATPHSLAPCRAMLELHFEPRQSAWWLHRLKSSDSAFQRSRAPTTMWTSSARLAHLHE